MIEINLLPNDQKAKQKKVLDLKKIPILPIAVGVIGSLIIVHIVLIVTIRINKIALTKVKKQWEEISPKKTMMDALKKRVAGINAKIGAIEGLTEKRILWAKKLNDLSDLMPSNIWISNLSYDKSGQMPSLILDGFAAGTTGEGATYVARFIKAMKNNNDFFKDFRDIELGSMRRSLIDKDEVMNFKIICTFRNSGKNQTKSKAFSSKKRR